jgi:hypothetical protein
MLHLNAVRHSSSVENVTSVEQQTVGLQLPIELSFLTEWQLRRNIG